MTTEDRRAEAPTPPMGGLREAHLASAAKNCRCVWCTETSPNEEATHSLFDTEEP